MKTDDDVRAALRRAAHSAEPSPGAFVRTMDRHAAAAGRPPERSRASRLAAAAVAIVLASAAFALVVRAFDSEGAVEHQPASPVFDPRIVTSFPIGPRGQVGSIVAGFGS